MTTIGLEPADWARLLEAATTGPPLGSSVQDARVEGVLRAAVPPPPSTVTDIAIALSVDGTAGVVTAYPPLAKAAKWAYMATPTTPGSEIKYSEAKSLTAPFVPPPGYPVIDAVAVDSEGKTVGRWAVQVTGKRLVTTGTPVPPPPPTGLQTGIVTNSDNTFMDLKPKHNRSEYGAGTTAMGAKGAAEGYRAKGSLLQPLVSMSAMTTPASVAGSIKAWIGSGVKLVELGNELNYVNKSGPSKAAGENYGRIVKACCEVLTPAGIGCLAIGEDGGTKSNAFLEGMLASTPNIVDLIAKGGGGLTIHPYYGTPPGSYGNEKMDRMVAFWDAHGGSSLPIYGTEWGVPSDDGVHFTSGQQATYAEAGEVIDKHPKVLQEHAKGKLAQLLMYQTHDNKAHGATTDREAYFGARKLDGSRKGAMSDAADAFLAKSV